MVSVNDIIQDCNAIETNLKKGITSGVPSPISAEYLVNFVTSVRELIVTTQIALDRVTESHVELSGAGQHIEALLGAVIINNGGKIDVEKESYNRFLDSPVGVYQKPLSEDMITLFIDRKL